MLDRGVVVVELVLAGQTLAEAGRAVGISQTSAWRIVAAAGDIPRKKRPRVSQSTVRQINHLLSAGLTAGQVAERLSVSKNTVLRYDCTRPRGKCTPRRCPGCGAKITQTPCLACMVKSE
jgi:predicted DNA-binding protein (UPF0251 family)